MMKRKIPIIATATLLCILAVAAYLALDSIFPKANPINLPETKRIISASLIRNDGNTVTAEAAAIENLLKNISDAHPTRTMSVNDYPTVKTYYTVELRTFAHLYRYFIYEDKSQVYIEIPYEGIYKADLQALDLISEYFED